LTLILIYFHSELNAVKTLNQVLHGNDPNATLAALQNKRLNLNVLTGAQALYHEELRSMKAEKQVGSHQLVVGILLPVVLHIILLIFALTG